MNGTNTMSAKKHYINYMIMFMLTIVISLLPPVGAITPFGMQVIGILVGVLYGWIKIGLVVPSVFAMLALGISGYNSVLGVFSTGLGQQQVLLVIFSGLLAGAMEEAGLTAYLTKILLSQKILMKSPWYLIIGMFLGGYIISACGATIPIFFILFSVMNEIAKKCGYAEGDRTITSLKFILGCVIFYGGFLFPFRASALMFLAFFTPVVPAAYPYGSFILVILAYHILFTVMLLLLAKFVFRLDVSKLRATPELLEVYTKTETTKTQKLSLALLIVYVLALLLPGFFPEVPGMAFLSRMGIAGVTSILLLIMSILQVDGKTMIDLGQLFVKHTQWSVWLLMAATIPLAAAMQSADAGVMATINQVVRPLFAGMDPYVFLIVAMVILGIGTQFVHNLVLGAMFIPFLVPIFMELGGNPYVLFTVLYIAFNCSFATPAASTQSGMLHAQPGIDPKIAYGLGFASLFMTFIIVAVLIIPLSNILLQGLV